MKIEVLYFRGCPNHVSSVEQVKLALQSANLDEPIEEIEVLDPAMAQQLAFLGSPSIRVDGLDIEPDARSANVFGYGCRTYAASGRRTGTPPIDLISQALLEAMQRNSAGATG